MGMPGLSELMIIFAVVLLLFGGKKLPQLGGAIGESIRNFRKGLKEGDDSADNAAHKGLDSGIAQPSEEHPKN